MPINLNYLPVLSLLWILAGCASPSSDSRAQAPSAIATPVIAQPAPSTPTIAPAIAPASTPAANARDLPTGPTPTSGYMARPDVQAFANQVARQRDLTPSAVGTLISQAQRLPVAIRLMTPATPGQPVQPRDWARYRSNFVDPVRVRGGKAFMAENSATLAQAQAQFGVPANIIAAIIGVETNYGQNMGNYRVLDALVTLSFDYPDAKRPDRIEMFQGQLADFIELHYQGKLDARRALGSYAGAMGIPQFMPTSLKLWAVASDPSTGRIDLEYNVNDAILSVAHFLKVHGWVTGLPVFAPVDLPAQAAELVDGGLTPTLSWTELVEAGARLAPGASLGAWAQDKLGVINLALPNLNTVQYRTATPNFFALTQYNRSYFYAAAVADLAQALLD